MKVHPSYAQGLEFVSRSQLPFYQAETLRNYLPVTSFMKLQIGDETLENCISYDEYEYWLENMLEPEDSREYDF